jgi:hypothetical protein
VTVEGNVTTQFTTHTKVMAARAAAKYKMRSDLMEPTIGLEPMTCRLRILCNDGIPRNPNHLQSSDPI